MSGTPQIDRGPEETAARIEAMRVDFKRSSVLFAVLALCLDAVLIAALLTRTIEFDALSAIGGILALYFTYVVYRDSELFHGAVDARELHRRESGV